MPSFFGDHDHWCYSVEHPFLRKISANHLGSAIRCHLLVHILVFASHMPIFGTVWSCARTCSGHLFFSIFTADNSTSTEGVATADIGRKIVRDAKIPSFFLGGTFENAYPRNCKRTIRRLELWRAEF